MIFQTILNRLRSWFRLTPPQVRSFNIETRYDYYANAFVNRLWYHGDAWELNQFYRTDEGDTTRRFWASAPTSGLEMRKSHTGIPQIMADMLSGIIVRDLNGLGIDDNTTCGRDWDIIAQENTFDRLIESAVKDVLVVGDGAFKISFDPRLSDYPVIEWFGGDRCSYTLVRGRITAVTFRTEYDRVGTLYTLEEEYGYGYVKYKLHKNDDDKSLPLNLFPETAGLCDVTFDDDIRLAVPFSVAASDRYPGRGKSIFDAKTDAFDALDEAWSQWLQAMRMARPVRYIPESLIPRDLHTGELMSPNPFDCQYIKIENDNHENGRNEITVSQPVYNAEQYIQTYITALDNALQGIISPSTLGIDTKKLDNAEAQREKEKTTLYTRNKIVSALTTVLKVLVETALRAYYMQTGAADVEVSEVLPVFGEYANPSFEAVVETLSNPNTPMSIEAKVEEMWGDSKDDEWKAREVARIKVQTGVAVMNYDV